MTGNCTMGSFSFDGLPIRAYLESFDVQMLECSSEPPKGAYIFLIFDRIRSHIWLMRHLLRLKIEKVSLQLPILMSSNPMNQNLKFKRILELIHPLCQNKQVANITKKLSTNCKSYQQENYNLELRNHSAHLRHSSCKPTHTLLHS
jgi:hypothetical protein